MLGVQPRALRDTGEDGLPRWRSLTVVEFRAVAPGVVDELPVASGAWIDAHSLVLSVTDTGKVRFRARGLQSDLPSLRDGMVAAVVPAGAAGPGGHRTTGELQIGVRADPEQRTIDLYVTPHEPPAFARPGLAAFLEIELTTTGEPALAVPLGSVMRDGLRQVLFRRNPKDKDQVIRIEADLGVDDGRWIEVKSGLVDGDEVVLDGAYELMLASSATAAKGGHFHADGTWHADDHR
jgi:cobalt-zinc-cadmium efflux system membrane fusion protein